MVAEQTSLKVVTPDRYSKRVLLSLGGHFDGLNPVYRKDWIDETIGLVGVGGDPIIVEGIVCGQPVIGYIVKSELRMCLYSKFDPQREMTSFFFDSSYNAWVGESNSHYGCLAANLAHGVILDQSPKKLTIR